MNAKIVEIIPDNLPDWTVVAMNEGQLFNRMIERIELLTALVIAVKSSEFDGFSFDRVNDENWFDAQENVLKTYR